MHPTEALLFKLIILGTLFFLTEPANCQDTLLVLKKQSITKVKLLKEKSRIKVKTIDGLKFKGRFNFINDSTIIIKNSTVLLSDITSIEHIRVIPRIVGTALIILGSSQLTAGVIFYPILGDFIFAYAITGTSFTTLGILTREYPENHRKCNGWKYQLKVE